MGGGYFVRLQEGLRKLQASIGAAFCQDRGPLLNTGNGTH